MSTRPSLRVTPKSDRRSADDGTIEISDKTVKFTQPQWAKTALGVIAILTSLIGTITPLYVAHRSDDRKLTALSHFAKLQTTEDQKHRGEDPDKTIPISGGQGAEKVELKHYHSDGCFLVVRSTPDGVTTSTLWVPRFSRDDMMPSPGRLDGVQKVETGSIVAPTAPTAAGLLPDTLPLATFLAVPPQAQPVQACSGHCSERHSGQPATTYGQTKQCWVQVIRTWADGCSQYQWYDTCHSVWDPKIYWTCCRD